MSVLVNDLVQVMAGRDKGKTGVVRRKIKGKKGDRAIVEGINKVTKHLKGSEGKPGQKIEVESTIHISNLMLVCPKTKKPTRTACDISKDGEKRRISKKSGEIIKGHKPKKK